MVQIYQRGSEIVNPFSEIREIKQPEMEKNRNIIKAFEKALVESYNKSEVGNTLGSVENLKEKKDSPQGLTEQEKEKIKEQTGWSDEICDSIRSMEEAEIYMKAGLKEVEIGGKKCLIRTDIDWNQVDEKGRTNQERVERGLAPLDQKGDAIQLHHIGQRADSPLAELTFEEHRCDGNDTVLHDKTKETETHGAGNTWDNERQNYWKERGNYNEGGVDNG